VYVVNYDGGLLRISKSTGSITPIATGNTWDVATYGSFVYWTTSTAGGTDGRVTRAALDGSGAIDIATGQATAAALVADSSGVYWLTGNGATDGVIMRLGPNDLAPFAFASNQPTLDSIATDANSVYWMSAGAKGDGTDGAVYSKAKSGGSITTIAAMQPDAGGTGVSITTAGGKVFWDPRGLGGSDGVVRSASVTGGGGVTTYATNQQRPQGIVADASFVYWISYGTGTNGLLQKASLTTRVITQLAGALASPTALALDNGVLYFVTQGNGAIAGGLYRIVP
jgi:hypothetical protein